MFEDLDFRETTRLTGVGLFYFGLLMLFLLYFGDNIQKAFHWLIPQNSEEQPEVKELSAAVLVEQQEAAKQKLEKDHRSKVEDYRERILKPREEAKKTELEKEFSRFSGAAWKGKGERTRSLDEARNDDQGDRSNQALRRRDLQRTSRDAAAARKLPESVTNPPRPPPAKPRRAKSVVTLADEPEQGTPKSITIALRGITGLVKKRRFLYTDCVQVLFDWMMKLGYHQKTYTLIIPYPRQELSQHATRTLEETGVNHDITIIVEEIPKDDDS